MSRRPIGAASATSLEDIFDGDNYTWRARLTYRCRSATARPRPAYANRARSGREQSEVDLRNQEQTIRVEVRKRGPGRRFGHPSASRRRSKSTSSCSKEKLDAEQKKFDNGMSTSFEVLTFQNDLADAELSEIRAALDYVKALAALERSKGTLLEVRGLALDPDARSPPGAGEGRPGPCARLIERG